jgi:hypothetical protein
MAKKNKSQLENIYNKATQLGKENSVMKVAELLGYKNIFTFKNDLLNACMELSKAPPVFARRRRSGAAKNAVKRSKVVEAEVKASKSGSPKLTVPKEVFQALKAEAGDKLRYELGRKKVVISKV